MGKILNKIQIIIISTISSHNWHVVFELQWFTKEKFSDFRRDMHSQLSIGLRTPYWFILTASCIYVPVLAPESNWVWDPFMIPFYYQLFIHRILSNLWTHSLLGFISYLHSKCTHNVVRKFVFKIFPGSMSVKYMPR